jgi:hypothetical protein
MGDMRNPMHNGATDRADAGGSDPRAGARAEPDELTVLREKNRKLAEIVAHLSQIAIKAAVERK